MCRRRSTASFVSQGVKISEIETTRFAPSPTGILHLGHAYSAWYALQAAGEGGRYVVRIEDIDPTRCRQEFKELIIEDLTWMNLISKGVVRVQSEHVGDYKSALDRLKGLQFLYPCFCSRKDIQEAVSAPHGPKVQRYPGTCRHLDGSFVEDRIGSGASFCYRIDAQFALKVIGPLTFVERGCLRTIRSEDVEDFVVARKETPTSYHLSCVLDDALQGISLVTRGADLIDSVPAQRLLQEALGLPEPRYSHHPLVTGTDGRKLSKRDNSISLQELRRLGMSPDEIIDLAKSRLASPD